MQSFRPLEAAARYSFTFFERKTLLEQWADYVVELRQTANWHSDPRTSILTIFREHPSYDWRSFNGLYKECGFSPAFLTVALNLLLADGIVVKKEDWSTDALGELNVYYGLKERVQKLARKTVSVKPLCTMHDELGKILKDACMRVQEAVKINEQLNALKQRVSGEQNSPLRELEGAKP